MEVGNFVDFLVVETLPMATVAFVNRTSQELWFDKHSIDSILSGGLELSSWPIVPFKDSWMKDS